MKAIRFMQPEVIEYSEIPAPQVKDNEVLAKIAYAGFCATDIELLTGEMVHIKNGNTKYPARSCPLPRSFRSTHGPE